MKTNLLIF